MQWDSDRVTVYPERTSSSEASPSRQFVCLVLGDHRIKVEEVSVTPDVIRRSSDNLRLRRGYLAVNTLIMWVQLVASLELRVPAVEGKQKSLPRTFPKEPHQVVWACVRLVATDTQPCGHAPFAQCWLLSAPPVTLTFLTSIFKSCFVVCVFV